MTLTEMDLVRGAIAQGIGEGICMEDLWFCADVTVDAPRHERISGRLRY